MFLGFFGELLGAEFGSFCFGFFVKVQNFLFKLRSSFGAFFLNIFNINFDKARVITATIAKTKSLHTSLLNFI